MLVRRETEAEQKLSTFDALNLELTKLKQAQSSNQIPTNYDDNNHVCPVPDCSLPITGMTAVETVAHTRTHTDTELAPPFTCPLESASGDRCNHLVSLKDDAFDFTVHYQHKLFEDQQETVRDNVSGLLRASIELAREQNESNKAFIQKRAHLLGSDTPKIPPPRKNFGQTLPDRSLYCSPIRSRTITTSGSLSLPQGTHRFETAGGEEMTLEETLDKLPPNTLLLTDGSKDSAAATRTTIIAQEKLARPRKRHIPVSDKSYKEVDLDESESESEWESESKSVEEV